MMEGTDNKMYMGELASMLAQKCNITKKEALQFLTDFVGCIKKGVETDRQVKVKGLGTFKVVDVEARNSVNVNTGERVLIEGHQKLNFTPDTLMKELVNKPFSQFETVLLNDGVEYSDMEKIEETIEEPEETVEEPAESPVVIQERPIEEPEEAVEEPAESLVVIPEEPAEEPEEAVEEPAESSVVIPEEPVEEPKEVVEEPIDEEEEEPEVQETSGRSYTWLWIILVVLACVVSFAWGYWFGSKQQQKEESVEIVVTEEPEASESPEEPVTSEQPTEVATPEPQKETDEVPQQPVVEPKKTEAPQADWQKYDAMDQRIRLGFYGIVGIKDTVTARNGETLARLSRRILGNDMECYVEAVNGNLKATDTLAAGQKIKIPQLVSKKILKKQLEDSNQ